MKILSDSCQQYLKENGMQRSKCSISYADAFRWISYNINRFYFALNNDGSISICSRKNGQFKNVIYRSVNTGNLETTIVELINYIVQTKLLNK